VLVGSPVRFAAGTRLPASIEQLRFVDRSSDRLPEQVRLPAMQHWHEQCSAALESAHPSCVLSPSRNESSAHPASRAMQVWQLPCLSAITFEELCQAGDHYSPLTSLPALTRLQLFCNHHLPTCLGQLTGLQALVSGWVCCGMAKQTGCRSSRLALLRAVPALLCCMPAVQACTPWHGRLMHPLALPGCDAGARGRHAV